MNDTIIRLNRPEDINILKGLDLKTYDYPWDMDNWRKILSDKDARTVLVEMLHKPVGFAVWSISEEEKEICHLHKMGVLSKYRKHGLGRFLVSACYQHAANNGCKCIKITVPDVLCSPGDPDDVSEFLHKVGFMATGGILSNWKCFYGAWVDGYTFMRHINVES